jgi:hypothetical protein
MKQIVMDKQENHVVNIEYVSDKDLYEGIVILKYIGDRHQEHAILSREPSSGIYFFKAFNHSYNNYYTNISKYPTEVLKSFDPSNHEFYMFDSLKEFANWLNDQLNHEGRNLH